MACPIVVVMGIQCTKFELSATHPFFVTSVHRRDGRTDKQKKYNAYHNVVS